MAEKVKIYEEKKGLPIWAWLLPLLVLLAVAAYLLLRHKTETLGGPIAVTQSAPTAAFPDLGMVHFATDQATLTPEGKDTLNKAAAAMKANPTAHLRLEGYTDSTGTTPHNDSLSDRRTTAVADYLKASGIEGSRLTGEGFGPEKPVDTNATPNGKADNRRVELFSQK